MKPPEPAVLRKLLRDAGIEWWIAQDAGRIYKTAVDDVGAVAQLYRERYGEEIDLWARIVALPDEMRAFVQSFAMPISNAFRLMVLRLLDGSTILSVDFHYEERREARLRIRLRDRRGSEEAFESDDLWDAHVLRHLGFMKIGDEPVLDGFYALRS